VAGLDLNAQTDSRTYALNNKAVSRWGRGKPGRVAQAVECLPSKGEAMSSNCSTAIKRKQTTTRRLGGGGGEKLFTRRDDV
jgi:hypothetical protein